MQSPPPRGGGLGRGCVPPPLLFERLHDHLQHAFGISKHVVVPETDHAEASSLQISGARLIPCDLRIVLPTINLDHEVCGQAGEIDDVVINRDLPPEQLTFKIVASHQIPKPLLGFGHALAQFAGALQSF